ncbi:hypothetical protein G6321_00023835 [Bradyrhizobium barranii subsp. barranii]|uniref:Uncharacterized protein n=1 Tax=Bradyrhizobium barranii subsp. barranii TaxID=2823807 RepID=A0A7Z0QKC0_9BRAD|nr:MULTISPECIES: hypothetical protein [Bradyrhizobium]MBR0733271.1 hypothetical protein [Bradyrhizobium japonicum]UGX97994.1 hypothetical protein G6321_00023835 [Bradyrhizobium barranii subsp. barranii]
MHRFIARANVDHYLGILNGTNLTPQHRSTTMALLIAELDKLSEDAEHLGFAESKLACSRDQVTRAASIRDSVAAGTSEREHAERHLVHLENIHTVIDNFCHRLRNKIASRPS